MMSSGLELVLSGSLQVYLERTVFCPQHKKVNIWYSLCHTCIPSCSISLCYPLIVALSPHTVMETLPIFFLNIFFTIDPLKIPPRHISGINLRIYAFMNNVLLETLWALSCVCQVDSCVLCLSRQSVLNCHRLVPIHDFDTLHHTVLSPQSRRVELPRITDWNSCWFQWKVLLLHGWTCIVLTKTFMRRQSEKSVVNIFMQRASASGVVTVPCKSSISDQTVVRSDLGIIIWVIVGNTINGKDLVL